MQAKQLNTTAGLRAVNEGSKARREALDDLYLGCYSDIRDAALADGSMRFDEAEVLLGAVARLLPSYDGSLEDAEQFKTWAISQIVQPGLIKIRAFEAMRQEFSGAVRNGIWSILKSCNDLGIHRPGVPKGERSGCVGTVAELEQEAWTKVWFDLDRWLLPGKARAPDRKPATLKTRLHSHGRFQARAWRTAQLRSRHRFVRGDLAQLEQRMVERAINRAHGQPHRADAAESFAFA
jgi:hypothetical protein